MEIKHIKEKAFLIFIFFSASYYIIGFMAGFNRDLQCSEQMVHNIKKRNINGVLINKEKNCMHKHLYFNLKVGDAIIKHHIGYPFACMFDYAEPNDSIVKIENEIDYVVIRNGKKRFFSMDCEHDCSCSRVP